MRARCRRHAAGAGAQQQMRTAVTLTTDGGGLTHTCLAFIFYFFTCMYILTLHATTFIATSKDDDADDDDDHVRAPAGQPGVQVGRLLDGSDRGRRRIVVVGGCAAMDYDCRCTTKRLCVGQTSSHLTE